MNRNRQAGRCAALALLVCLSTLWACEARISQKNFERIQTGMKMPEVVAIIGEPTTSTGLDLGVFSAGSATWEGSQGSISLQFLNGQVALKTFTRGRPAEKTKGS